VAKNPHVDRVVGYRNNPLHRALLFLRSLPYEYDSVLVFHSNEDLWPVLRGIRYRVCYNRQNFRNEEKRVFPLESLPRHSVQRRLALVEKIGGKKTADYRYEFSIPREYRVWAAKKFQGWGITPQDAVVGFQLGAADLFKCWPVEDYAAVAGYLRTSRGAKIYVNVSPEEADLGRRFLDLAGKEGVFLTPAGGVFRSAALIQRCNLFISPDTGPMHMAIGLGVPLIGLFCPTSVEETGPLGYGGAVILKKEKTCQPCLNRGCRDNFCMRQITVEEVCRAADRILDAPSPGKKENVE
jgi:heptosyltransferase-2